MAFFDAQFILLTNISLHFIQRLVTSIEMAPFFHFGMATRFAILRDAGRKLRSILGFNRWIHSVPQPPPLAGSIDLGVRLSQPVMPEFSSPSFSFGGSMELMAVPKKKISKHKRGIRNGPKALKPVPVLVLCKSCGRVRLPHFYCCGGKPKTENNGEENSTS